MELITTSVAMTKDIGVHNNLFGGVMLAWLDEAGASMASQVCNTPRMVTKKIDEIIFQQPVKSGNIIKIYGGVANIGNTSITLVLEARRYNVYTSEETIVCSTRMMFVRIDDEGGKLPISSRIRKKYGFEQDEMVEKIEIKKIQKSDLISA